jgi:hypothetical protein
MGRSAQNVRKLSSFHSSLDGLDSLCMVDSLGKAEASVVQLSSRHAQMMMPKKHSSHFEIKDGGYF